MREPHASPTRRSRKCIQVLTTTICMVLAIHGVSFGQYLASIDERLRTSAFQKTLTGQLERDWVSTLLKTPLDTPAAERIHAACRDAAGHSRLVKIEREIGTLLEEDPVLGPLYTRRLTQRQRQLTALFYRNGSVGTAQHRAGILWINATPDDYRWFFSSFSQSSGAFPVPGVTPILKWFPDWGQKTRMKSLALIVDPEPVEQVDDPLYKAVGALQDGQSITVVTRDGKVYELLNPSKSADLRFLGRIQIAGNDPSSTYSLLSLCRDGKGLPNCVFARHSPGKPSSLEWHAFSVDNSAKPLDVPSLAIERSLFLGFRRGSTECVVIYDTLQHRVTAITRNGEKSFDESLASAPSVVELSQMINDEEGMRLGGGWFAEWCRWGNSASFSHIAAPLATTRGEKLISYLRGTIKYLFHGNEEYLSYLDFSTGDITIQPFDDSKKSWIVPKDGTIIDYGLGFANDELLVFTSELIEGENYSQLCVFRAYACRAGKWTKLDEWHPRMVVRSHESAERNIVDFSVIQTGDHVMLCWMPRLTYFGQMGWGETRIYRTRNSVEVINDERRPQR